MMQMLAAGGMEMLTDYERKPDTDNPKGYCEWEPAKLLPKQPARIDEAEGKVVKVISQLLMAIPDGREYKVVFMQRPLPEVLNSQDEMLRRRGTSDFVSHEVMTPAFEGHLRKVEAWLKTRPEIAILRMPYRRVLDDPRGSAEQLKTFLGLNLDVEKMAEQVDPSLYRNRS